jgi:hypothetical protein
MDAHFRRYEPNGLAEVNAGAKFNAPLWRQISVTLIIEF